MKQSLSALLRNLRYGAQTRAAESTVSAPVPAPSNILLASSREEDRIGLRRTLLDPRWTILEAGYWTDALRLAEQVTFSVALCDVELSGMDWREGVRRLRLTRPSPATILLSNVADRYLWEELVSVGAFDVLTRPFRDNEAVSMIEFAYMHWKTGPSGWRADVPERS